MHVPYIPGILHLRQVNLVTLPIICLTLSVTFGPVKAEVVGTKYKIVHTIKAMARVGKIAFFTMVLNLFTIGWGTEPPSVDFSLSMVR